MRPRFLVFAVVLPLACRAAPREEHQGYVPAPTNDAPGVCADVATVRACWQEGRPVLRVDRATPPARATEPWAWRCTGAGAARRCTPRDGTVELPSVAEWSCADLSGALVCVELADAAGVPPGPDTEGFLCGRTARGARVCVDYSPWYPHGDPSRWRHSHHEGEWKCEALPAPRPALGTPCGRERPCVDGAFCADGYCLPRVLRAECVTDRDCGAPARCRFGACLEEAS